MNTLPISIQDFPTLREENYVYVDKTQLIHGLLESGKSYFLSRPRRFGKSLLVSTLKAIFDGRKDLFKSLWLEDNHDFVVHPVIRLDFSRLDFSARPLEVSVLDSLQQSAFEYGLILEQDTVRSAFEELIYKLSNQAKVVVLIDEYDKPITDYLLEPEKRNAHQAVLRSLYGVLKPMNAYLELVFLTGVSKIGKLSLFSDLNNLQDISLNPKYATLCGYSRSEIEIGFPTYLKALAQKFSLDLETLWESIKHWYNGYSWDGESRVYCPFSFLLFLEQQQFKSFWYETGTPTFLLELVRKARINPFKFEHFDLPDRALVADNVDNLDPVGLMFQTGYLTIGRLQSDTLGLRYTLRYPNEEVRRSFSSGLLTEYSQSLPSFEGSFSLELQQALLDLNWRVFFATINRILTSIPYEIFPAKEDYIHSLVHLMLISTGLRTQSQVQTAHGRINTLLETPSHSIIFEFKLKGTAKSALKQIDALGYADGISRPVVKVGVRFDLEKKQITQWVVA